MLDGKYTSSLNTPMGAINGVITLMSNGNQVQGIVENYGDEKPISRHEDKRKYS